MSLIEPSLHEPAQVGGLPDGLHWVEYGRGRPVILIHGAFVDHRDWPRTIIDPLSSTNQVFVIDRPGHGRSPRRRGASDAKAQAHQICQALSSRLGEPALIVAHSFGALSALAFAEAYPELVRGLVLVSPACFPEWRPEHVYLAPRALPVVGPPLSALANATLDPLYLQYIRLAMFTPQPIPERWAEVFSTGKLISAKSFVVEGEDALAASPLTTGAYRQLTRLKLPVTLLQGDADMIILSGWHARLLATLLPHVRLVWLSGVGHMLHHARPEMIVSEAQAILRAKS